MAALPVPAGFAFRAATVADAPVVGRAVAEGSRGYGAFAPAGWAPSSAERETELVRDLLADGELWCLLAERGGALAGHVALRLFTPAGQARARRFYEREGWVQAGEPRDSAVGLPTVEYRLTLG